MTEPVKCSTLRAQDFSVASVGAPAATSGCAGNSSTFVLEFSPYGDTSSIPSLTYFTGGTLTDRADNLLVGVVKSSVDKAVPRLLSASVYDSNSNGKIDQIRATFSESLQSSSDVSSWTFVGAPSGMGSAPVSTSVSGNSATLTSSEPAAFETSTGGLSIAFAAASFWKDASGNLAAPKASLILGDSAAPRVTSAVTVENASGNYALDVTFSESLSGTSLSGFSLSGSATYSGTVTQTATKTFRFATADSAASNTAKPYSYSYVPGTVTDPSGNSLAAIGSTSFSDGIAPKIISRQTRDSNGNGKIDAVAIGFSETLNSNVSGLSAAVSGYSVSGYSSSGTGLTVSLTERGVPDTDTAPNVQITNVSLADVAGNLFGSEASVTAAADSV